MFYERRHMSDLHVNIIKHLYTRAYARSEASQRRRALKGAAAHGCRRKMRRTALLETPGLSENASGREDANSY